MGQFSLNEKEIISLVENNYYSTTPNRVSEHFSSAVLSINPLFPLLSHCSRIVVTFGKSKLSGFAIDSQFLSLILDLLFFLES